MPRRTTSVLRGVVDWSMRLVFGKRAICRMCSLIERPIDEPLIPSVQLALSKGVSLTSIQDDIVRIMLRKPDETYGFTARLARGECPR